jgi:hypothetical protein
VTTTHALFALKVQRKVSNGVAGLAAIGSSLDRQKSRQFLPSQRATNAPRKHPLLDILALSPSCVSPTPQLKRESSPWPELGGGAGARIEALGLLGVAAARRRNLALLQEGIRDRNRPIQGARFQFVIVTPHKR